MNALELLHSRNSAPKLTEPAPSGEVLDNMLKAAIRAPDHARLRPWRFLTIQGDARQRLGELMVAAGRQRAEQSGQAPLSAEDCAKVQAKALRAPLIIVVVVKLSEHPKVPVIEQRLSAGCAAHSLLLAAHAQGFAGIWRTGANAFDKTVFAGLGLVEDEEITGFLYLGSVDGRYKPLPELAVEDFCQDWQG